jgi:hypothetical protein
MWACFSSEPTFGPSSIFEYLRKFSIDIYGNIAYGMVVNMLLWNDSYIPLIVHQRCFNCKNIEIFTLLKISIFSVGSVAKALNVKNMDVAWPRYSRMGGGCVAYFKSHAFVKQGCEEKGWGRGI